ncbi:MAG: sn-glycerol-1-phosphate dehydrogenase [Ruminococcaceae bacterium]|nr:sn-glycerol-1-phosphate dehydrogenase [Oscillospiraceae bacterium]
MEYSMNTIKEGVLCECGKVHPESRVGFSIKRGAICDLPKLCADFECKKAFVVADENTFAAAGKKVCSVFDENSVAYTKYIFPSEKLEPNENSVGSVIMHFDDKCDIIVGVGSGVINDICKIVSRVTARKYIIVATAPSMDGYASASSSVIRAGLKISLNSRCPDYIVGDLDVLCNAPKKMLAAGLGDMLAKYVSICEWRISNLINGEYYCEKVASLVRKAVQDCVADPVGLMNRDETAVKAVFYGLVVGGISMYYAGASRPASGVEHYFSHVWDMRAEEFGTPCELHGIQCAIGTLMALKLYEKIKKITPDREKAKRFVEAFSYDEWKNVLSSYLGKAADAMIALEKKEGKYDVQKHSARLDVIIENWTKILDIIDEELPGAEYIEKLLDIIDCPKRASEIGINEKDNPVTFAATKDIRDKYVLSRLAWDLGVIDEIM